MENLEDELLETADHDSLNGEDNDAVSMLVPQDPLGEPSNFKIVAVQSLAGNNNIAQNFLSEMHDDELKKPKASDTEKDENSCRPKLKIVPLSSLKKPSISAVPIIETAIDNMNDADHKRVADESTYYLTDDDDCGPSQVKRFKVVKSTTSNLVNKLRQPHVDNKSPADPIDVDMRPSGSSRRKSRITTRNADFDEPSVVNVNNVVVNAMRDEQEQKIRETPQGSKTELDLMRNVAFLRVCVNHILTKIGRRPISYDRNNQTLASLIQKYARS